MSFAPFDLERWQSTWENRVRVNLSESGVHAPPIAELLALTGRDPAEMLALRLGYSQSEGTLALRDAIAAHYPGATADHVTVTIGSAEANFVACWTLLRPGDHVAALTPTYMQVPGLARNIGCTVSEFRLHAECAWEPDPDEIAAAIRPGTRLVLVTNPNNPTGKVLSRPARDAILARVLEVGAWLLADEVFQGAERSGVTTPSFWGSADRVIVVNGLSKGWGLPGLRVGWIVASPALQHDLVRRHDYTVIGPGPAQDWLATAALGVRDRLLARTRGILASNWPVLEAWLGASGRFTWQAPDCGAIVFPAVEHPLPTLELVDRIRRDTDVLLVPGDHFGSPGRLRLGYGNRPAELTEGLERLRAWFDRPGAPAATA